MRDPTDDAWSEPAFERIAARLERLTGLRFPPGRRAGAEDGIRRAIGTVGAHSAAALLDGLEDEETLGVVVDQVTIGETTFFRDIDQLAYVETVALPEISARRGHDHVVRVWSAGCASGEEPYSLAIMLAERSIEGRVLGTDLSRAALARARRARYREWSLRGPGASRAIPYLHRDGVEWTLDRTIRERVSFGLLNLASDSYPSLANETFGVDLICCRNVLIYLTPETIAEVARRFYATLADGGWLVVGPSDPLLDRYAPFDVIVTDRGVFLRKPDKTRRAQLAPSIVAPLPDPRGSRAKPSADAPRSPPPKRAVALADPPRAVVAPIDENDAVRVRALASADERGAERVCADAARRRPLDAELQYLHGVLLLALDRPPDAIAAIRRALYLDPDFVIAHYVLGAIHERAGDRDSARKAYRRAAEEAARRPVGELLRCGDGETAGRFRLAAEAQFSILGVT